MRRRSLTFSGRACAAALGWALLACPAQAQTDDQLSGARAAANAGGKAYQEHRWSDAVDMFTRAESLVHSNVQLLYLARSYVQLHALVKAHETYIKITNEDLPATATDPMKQAKVDAQKELAALEPRLPYVSVVVQGAGPKPVTVTMDGVQVPAALVGVPHPVDPGDHRFEAVAEGMDSAVSTITVGEGRTETVVLTLHPSANPPATTSPAAPAATPQPYPVGYAPGVQPAGAGADSSNGPSPLTWVAFGVGAVGIGLGTVFALEETSKVHDGNALCNFGGPDGQSNWCQPSDASRVNSFDSSARTDRTVSIVSFVLGGAGVATGIALLFATPKHSSSATNTTVVPWVGVGSAGLSGKF